jgi:LysR family transcriptional regulator, glycine cleavage system transcriptional activator
MRRLPPLTALEAFIQVARTGSVKAAAEELALSTPALSRRIQALERYLGLSVFERRHQQMELNPNGEKLLAEIAPALDSIGEACEALTTAGRSLRIRLGVLALFASQRLFPRLPELRLSHPELHIDFDTSPNAIARLGDGLDAAIILAAEVDDALYARELERDVVSLIAAADRISGPRAITRPADIARETILVHRDMSTSFDVWKETVGLPDLQPESFDHYDSGPLMLEAAARGLGIAVMLGSHVQHAHDPRIGRLFETSAESPYRYFFVCRPKAMDNRAVRLFHDWLIKPEN